MLQDPIKIVGALRDAILHSPDRITQSHLFQQTSKFNKDEAHHLTPPGLVGSMDPPERTEVNGKVTSYLHELINEGSAELRGFPYWVLRPE